MVFSFTTSPCKWSWEWFDTCQEWTSSWWRSWHNKGAISQPSLRSRIFFIAFVDVLCFCTSIFDHLFKVVQTNFFSCFIVFTWVKSKESLSIFTRWSFQDIHVSWWVLVVRAPSNIIREIPVFASRIWCKEGHILKVFFRKHLDIDDDIFFTKRFFNWLFERLHPLNSWWSGLVHRHIDVNWEFHTICFQGSLRFCKLFLRFLRIEETVLTII